ncbi:hypothetical protein PILCRDRAFT_16506 [Piloderma croceum F 1598]|uniref:No apical meristem-associated C-terminal domain-containing protein n=1 Tax=Piloderma croceum (strain F 1598) TaxID=765440 RepID=A0A0C3AE03_PILCF|nr:hypothetical protein PILCRDRAFT_16506 [Piloderma croceum F 1598]
MGNTDKEKKKKSAKHQSAAAAKAKPPAKAKPRRARKLKSKAASQKNHMQDDTDSSDEGEGGDDGEDRGDVLQEDIDWKDVALSKALISVITNNPMIKQALFPSPGLNVLGSKGGGKPKTDFHWQLCQILFTNHETYGLALRKAEECTVVKKRAAWKRTWGIKIKNRLKKMGTITNGHKKTMGETGAGITRADKIDMTKENHFTNKWGEHPNIVPSGLGNGNSGMDMSTFTDGPGAASEEEEEEALGSPTQWGIENDESELPSDDEADEGEDGEDGGKPNKGKGKEKGSTMNGEVPKLGRTGTMPGKSKLATRPAKENKKKRKADEFADIAEAEELTRQRQLELARAKVEAKQATKQAEYAYKMQKMLDKKERRQEKNEERAEKMHFLRLREERGLGMGIPTGIHAATSGGSGGSSLSLTSHNTSIHSSLGNQGGLSDTFTDTSTPSGFYHINSPVLPANDHASSGPVDEFAFTHIPNTHSYSSHGTSSGQNSERGAEQMGTPSVAAAWLAGSWLSKPTLATGSARLTAKK